MRRPGETQRLVVETYKQHQDWTSYQIAEATDVAPTNVRTILSKVGLKLARARRPNLMDWERQAIIDAAGEKRLALALEFNRSLGCINSIHQRAGFVRPRFNRVAA